MADMAIDCLCWEWQVNPASAADALSAPTIRLLRAMAGSPELLILDFGGLALDALTVAKLEQALEGYLGTVVLGNAPAHLRPSWRCASARSPA